MGIDKREANGMYQMINKVIADNFQSKERHTHTGAKHTEHSQQQKRKSLLHIIVKALSRHSKDSGSGAAAPEQCSAAA